MADYIKRDDAIRAICGDCHWCDEPFRSSGYIDPCYSYTQIMSVPAADVVEVIRCKDCKHFEANDEYDYFLCVDHGGVVTPESYCSFADRKEEKDDG